MFLIDFNERQEKKKTNQTITAIKMMFNLRESLLSDISTELAIKKPMRYTVRPITSNYLKTKSNEHILHYKGSFYSWITPGAHQRQKSIPYKLSCSPRRFPSGSQSTASVFAIFSSYMRDEMIFKFKVAGCLQLFHYSCACTAIPKNYCPSLLIYFAFGFKPFYLIYREASSFSENSGFLLSANYLVKSLLP